MKPGYLEKNPFVFYLTPAETEVLKKCMAAQKLQGNMHKLQVRQEKVK